MVFPELFEHFVKPELMWLTKMRLASYFLFYILSRFFKTDFLINVVIFFYVKIKGGLKEDQVLGLIVLFLNFLLPTVLINVVIFLREITGWRNTTSYRGIPRPFGLCPMFVRGQSRPRYTYRINGWWKYTFALINL